MEMWSVSRTPLAAGDVRRRDTTPTVAAATRIDHPTSPEAFVIVKTYYASTIFTYLCRQLFPVPYPYVFPLCAPLYIHFMHISGHIFRFCNITGYEVKAEANLHV